MDISLNRNDRQFNEDAQKSAATHRYTAYKEDAISIQIKADTWFWWIRAAVCKRETYKDTFFSSSCNVGNCLNSAHNAH